MKRAPTTGAACLRLCCGALAIGAVVVLVPARAAAPVDDWTPLAATVRAQIASGHMPGAVLAIGDARQVWWQGAWGRRAVVPVPEAMTPDTIFDLASLTKVVATTTAVLQLVERGQLQLDEPVARYWPAFGVNGKQAITVRQLLVHRAGLPAGLELHTPWQGRAQALRRVLGLAPLAPPGKRTLYSDVDFIVLGELVQRVSGEPLERYVRRHILEPLAMHDSGYRLTADRLARIAPTEPVAGEMLRGRVHDPIARRMGGVAGHAGLFGTVGDLTRFAQALLNPGRVLSASSIAALQALHGEPDEDDPRGLGWQVQPPWVANRDALPPAGAVGHTGYTGTGLWIDFVQRRFLVLLTSRLHPHGRGDARPLRRDLLALLASLSAPVPVPGERAPRAGSAPAVALGVDVLREQGYQALTDRRVALLTHAAALDGTGWRTLDRLRWAPNVTLVRLVTPEHGLYADVEGAGDASRREPFSGLPVQPVYGRAAPAAWAAALADVDTLVVDLQDAGVRFYTYVATLADAMRAARQRGVRVTVLDRPNPVGADRVAGPVLDVGRGSLTGYEGLPVQHGMTVGELARLIADDLREQGGPAVDLQVIPMQGYRRAMGFEQTGIDWMPPSPNLRTPTQALLYPGVAWIEGANISVGRGTDWPFELVGAPWIDGAGWSATLSAAGVPGVRFVPADFMPSSSRYAGQRCEGVRVEIVERDAFDAQRLGAALAGTLALRWPERFELERIAALIGSEVTMSDLRLGSSVDEMVAHWRDRLDAFRARRDRYLLY